tara:strand:- start:597 stop:707 length:111 start_codon:yes stop_codon:yes gene_type:complete
MIDFDKVEEDHRSEDRVISGDAFVVYSHQSDPVEKS